MKLGVWVTICIVSLLGTNSFAGVSCQDLFSETKAVVKVEKVKSNVANKKQLNEIVEAVATIVATKRRMPTAQDIADSLTTPVPVSVIKEFLNKTSSPDMEGLIAIAKETYPGMFEPLHVELAHEAGDFLLKNMRLPTIKELAELLKVSQKEITILYGGNKNILAKISQYNDRYLLEDITEKLMKSYVKAARTYGRSPTLEEVANTDESKLTVEGLESLIGKGKFIEDISELHKMAEKKNPKSLKGVVNLDIYNEQKFNDLMKDIKVGERLVITTGIAGAPINKDFLAALKTYHKENKAPLFIKPVNNETTGLDEAIQNEKFVHVLISEVELGSELKLSNIPLTAKQINPLSGLNRIGKRGQSLVVGSPKMHMDVVATKENQFRPHMLLTTGSINDPNVYQGSQYISKRTDYIAEEDHVMGALIIEKTSASNELSGASSSGTFHMRHIEYIPEIKGFVDLDKKYTADGVETVRAELIAFGDTHGIEMDQKVALTVKKQLIQKFQPKEIVDNDILNGTSISHYDRDKVITLSQHAERGLLNLEAELQFVTYNVRGLFAEAPKDMTYSVDDANHNNWLMRYLNAGHFMRDPQNTKLGLELAKVMNDGINPLKYYFEKVLEPELMKRIVFIESDEARYAGPEHRRVLVSEHGDRGANGAKGSMGSFQRGADRSGFGHTHTVQRRKGAINYGTMSNNPMDYSKGGFSNWVQAVMVVGPNGEQQVLMFKNGEWYRDPSKAINNEEFFEPGFPFAKPNNAPTNAVQVDQYTTKRRN